MYTSLGGYKESDILHSLQNYLMGLIAKDLEHKSTNEDPLEEAYDDESDSSDCR